MGVALTSCTVPAVGRPTFDIGNDEMEMGVGIHGEKGRRRVQLAPADAVAEEMLGAIVKDLKPLSGDRALLLVNGFGGTPLMELTLMYDAARRALGGSGVEVVRSLVGNYVTSLDMAGVLHHPLPPGRRYAPLLGCPCPNRGAALGALAGRPLVQAFTQ